VKTVESALECLVHRDADLPDSRQVSDSQIIGGLKERDPTSMSDLYDRYGGMVYAVAYRMVRNRGEAEDLVQERFLRVWTRAHLIDDSRGTLRPWLLTITRNVVIDHVRAKDGCAWRFEPTSYEQVPDAASYCPELAQRRERLLGAFAQLPADQRSAIEFAYFEGLSQSEISERMGRPLGTVKTWLRTALGSLRTSISMNGRVNSR
jgi:RNA polymerase sigma-70 factor (ECF subfamily)